MVLGTKFNVRSYSVEDRHVTLVNGKVQVTNTVNNKSVTLRPGQDLTYTETGEEKVSEVNIATYTAWTEGMFYFEDVPLEEIMGALGRWYNVNIDFERCELYHIRLNFWANKNTHLDEALELLNKFEAATGVKVNYKIVGRRQGDIVKVWADPTFANEELGWQAKATIEETLKSAWNWQVKLRERGIQ